MSHPTDDEHVTRHGAPPALVVAAALVMVEGVVLLLLGVAETLNLDSERVTMGVTVSVFFVGFAVLLLLSGWGLLRVRPWARGPALLAQVIGLGLAWNFRGGTTRPVSVVLLVVAVVVLAGLLNRRSLEALDRD